MKKLLCTAVTILLVSLSSFAHAEGQSSWYFISEGKCERPRLPVVENDSAKGIGRAEKVLYLTFDAGYENGNVEKIVDILEENEVTGAFFVLRHFVEENTALCKRIKENGNLVCNHTSRHPPITSLTSQQLKSELEELETVYKSLTGYDLDPYFRPPEGVWNEQALNWVEDCGYKTVFWSLAWADWDNANQRSPEYAMDKLLTRVHDGAVILLHPTSKTNTEILDEFIHKMKEAGYRFGTLEELWSE
ncbi:MAG: polysaccharide deacetylase family protein [Clostridia bacterium]|nr:polysaccharide deacetylase family protein [Clostridia bacterium]